MLPVAARDPAVARRRSRFIGGANRFIRLKKFTNPADWFSMTQSGMQSGDGRPRRPQAQAAGASIT